MQQKAKQANESLGLESLFPDRASGEPVGRQFVRRLRHAIETGVFKPSSRLLPSRELALRLGLSRNTVTAAIEQLIAEGYVESRVGSGTFVVADIVQAGSVVEQSTLRTLPSTAQRFIALSRHHGPHMRQFGPLRAGTPDLSCFPHAVWARIARRNLREMANFLEHGNVAGYEPLRESIAAHVQQFRGIATGARCVIIVEGTQAAMRLTADVLLAAGDTALIEDPGYPYAWAALEAHGVRVVPIPVDAAGMNIELAPAARLAYVTPSHQFPLGAAMSLERRQRLFAWAQAHNAYIVEDDYDSEYNFTQKPLPALQSLDRNDCVVYVGSFSKTLAPGFRLGYIIAPPHLAGAFKLARRFSTLGGTTYVQATLAQFIAEGHFAQHVRRMTRLYGERREALLELLDAELPASDFTVGLGTTGLNLAVVAPPDYDDVAVANELLARGVSVAPLSQFCIARSDCRGFLLGYSAGPTKDMLAAAQMFARTARRQVAPAPGR